VESRPAPDLDLTERQARILRAVVEQYVRHAVPVSSETLVREHGLGVSSATVRNELAELEARGFICQPHTSAGRIPSDLGYRYFVERLMAERHLSRAERHTIRHQFHQVALVREQWLQLAAATLSRGVQAAAIVTAPHASQARLKHVEAVHMQEGLGLVIVVLLDGTVKQQLVALPEGVTQSRLSVATARLNPFLTGRTRAEFEARLAAISDDALGLDEWFVVAQIASIVKEVDSRSSDVYHAGLVELLDQPEFARNDRARAIVELLERPQALRDLLLPTVEPMPGEPVEIGTVHVVIGRENRWDWMRECSVVMTHYGTAGETFGFIGVLGPSRFPYAVAVPAVRFVARLMTEVLHHDWATGSAPRSFEEVGHDR
jgi:heat-inducible transcriptional repressor